MEKEQMKRKFKLYKNQIIAGFLTIAMMGTGLGLFLSKRKNKEPIQENSIGYSSVNPATNWLTNKVEEENFVMLEVGDFDSNKEWFVNEKIKFCNKNDISLGIIINSDAENELAIYKDVEYTKSIISKYDVNFPVYLDINNIIMNNSLNVEMKTKIIKSFLDKLTSNGVYVGMYGTDTNLTRVKEYCEITGYDAFLVKETENIKYDGTCSLVKELDGTITSKFKSKVNGEVTTDMSAVIESKGLNEKEAFADDACYVVGDESIVDIALNFGMSVDELLTFNGIKEKDVVKGTKLRIPSIIQAELFTEGEKVAFAPCEPKRGCDISHYQGTNINWELMKENFEFVILKCSQGMVKDSCFEENAKNCNLNNINMGVYCYNGMTLNNCPNVEVFEKAQISQVDFSLSTLKNKKIVYPVYLDIEDNVEKNIPKEYARVMFRIWKEKVAASGYIPGIYCNQSTFNYLQSCVDYKLSDVFEVWIAGGKQYTAGKKDIPLDNVRENKDYMSYTGAAMVQSTDSATGGGAGNAKGHIDVDFCNKDYSKKVTLGVGENWEILETDKLDEEDKLLVGLTAAGSFIAVGGSYLGKLKKEKERRKKK